MAETRRVSGQLWEFDGQKGKVVSEGIASRGVTVYRQDLYVVTFHSERREYIFTSERDTGTPQRGQRVLLDLAPDNRVVKWGVIPY